MFSLLMNRLKRLRGEVLCFREDESERRDGRRRSSSSSSCLLLVRGENAEAMGEETAQRMRSPRTANIIAKRTGVWAKEKAK
jgi:hypothetical protein